jgi:uncharacterized protein YggE
MIRIQKSAFRRALTVASMLLLAAASGHAQVSGNVAYGQTSARMRAAQAESGRRVLTREELPPSNTSMFLDAHVLMNVKADEYVAVFAVAEQGATAQESSDRMNATIGAFKEALRALRVPDGDDYVDYIAQPKVYGFELSGDIARERLAGFELKKNVSIRFSNRDMIDQLVLAAARAQIHDLVKVDYIVRDISAVQDSLMRVAAAVIKQKTARNEQLLGIHLQQPAQVYAERPAIHYPTDMYDSYVAAEADAIARPNLQRYTVEQARKPRTFYFNALTGDGFDRVVNPGVLEPVVQFTLYVKVKYELVLR